MAKRINRISTTEIRAMVRNKHEEIRLHDHLEKIHKQSVHKRGHYLKETSEMMESYRKVFKTTGWSVQAQKTDQSLSNKDCRNQLKPWSYFQGGSIEKWDKTLLESKIRRAVSCKYDTTARRYRACETDVVGRHHKSKPRSKSDSNIYFRSTSEWSGGDSDALANTDSRTREHRFKAEAVSTQIAGPERHIPRQFRLHSDERPKNDRRPKTVTCRRIERPERLSLDFLKMYVHPEDRYKTEELFLFRRIVKLKRDLAFKEIPVMPTHNMRSDPQVDIRVFFSQLSRNKALRDMMDQHTDELKVEKSVADNSRLDKKVENFLKSIKEFCDSNKEQ